MIFANAKKYCDKSFDKTELVDIYTEQGRIVSVKPHDKKKLAGDGATDLGGRFVLSGFIDSHLHFPGCTLYELFGVNLANLDSTEEYKQELDKKSNSSGLIRGCGWKQTAFSGEESYRAFKAYLDDTFKSIPIALFSSDYHACLCNQAFLDSVADIMVDNGDTLSDGLLTEENVFQIMDFCPNIHFTDGEIEQSIIAHQDFLLSRGITAVQGLMFLGAQNHHEIGIFHRLDTQGRLKMHYNLAITAQPNDTPEAVYKELLAAQRFNSSRLKVSSVKIYIDGVVENETAFLLYPYENSAESGELIWNEQELSNFCKYFQTMGVQLHIHAIGDGAVRRIADVLKQILKDDTANSNRHVITHLQLSAERDLDILAKHNILCTVQPFWFPIDGEHHAFDQDKIGNRAFDEYRAKSLFDKGIHTSFSSDSPVTPDPNPLLGVSMAMRHSNNREQVQYAEAMRAFLTNGAYQLGREQEIGRLDVGCMADFCVYDCDISAMSPIALSSATPSKVFFNGECVFCT